MVDHLRRWLSQVDTQRRPEALATLIDETVTHEMAYLIQGINGPVLIYMMEVGDPEQARRAVAESEHLIDAEHQAVMKAALAGAYPADLLLDLRPGPPDSN